METTFSIGYKPIHAIYIEFQRVLAGRIFYKNRFFPPKLLATNNIKCEKFGFKNWWVDLI